MHCKRVCVCVGTRLTVHRFLATLSRANLINIIINIIMIISSIINASGGSCS